MAHKTFKNGIHPDDNKRLTADYNIGQILQKPNGIMIYPMVQHLGAPCEPLVEVGERVLQGQKIGDSSAFVSSPVFSTVSGEVKEIKPALSANGGVFTSVFIQNDGKYEEHPSLSPKKPYNEYTKEERLSIIREAGIVGLGGAGFPAHIKLNPPKDKHVDTVLVNGCECEPFLTTDYRAMLEEGDRIVYGLEIILSLMDDDCRGILVIEDNKPAAVEHMQKLIEGRERMSIAVVKTKYPQGCEKQVINSVTGREVPSGKLPADAGCIVHNIDTVIAIARAFRRGRPLMRKIVTIAGGCVINPGNFKARLGTTYRELIEMNGGLKEEPAKIISGGPMMGVSLYSLDVPIVKTSSGILCLTKEEAYIPPETNCIRCGKCVAACPIGLMPLELNKYVLHGETDKFLKSCGMDCIECGSCSYVCPSKRHLAQSIRVWRREQLKKKA